jgi:hypothetical protein
MTADGLGERFEGKRAQGGTPSVPAKFFFLIIFSPPKICFFLAAIAALYRTMPSVGRSVTNEFQSYLYSFRINVQCIEYIEYIECIEYNAYDASIEFNA